ncbi:amidase [Roseinatronobacter alkalisoli]|uniref:Amidase family protein n=1 Tax=Roseinatronobacter alkalisoli TaxID=3028235 RepID=A0ABT5TD95_9RHOB|nr:amidase family protein [Roseinatronobacter sp. HJB301]MDD7971883.1 amidase family protein [Roseinatronobacter sp. HJB301]
MTDAWLTRPAADQGRAIDAGDLCPLALTEAYLAAINGHDAGPRIYARLTESRALDEAIAARDRARAGLRRHALDGVPLSWKDLFDTAGVATESGSAVLKGRVPGHDADLLQTMTRAGTICLGKTHQTEFAYSGLGLNPVTATPPCVNDPDAVPGGSSSGAAASVAFGLAAAAMGSDTGGSVRIPAAWNDLVGLKTTHGRLSLQGVVPLAPKFDTAGPLARSVEDCALLLSALENRPAPDLRGASLSGRRFLVLDGAPFDGIRDLPARAFEGAVDRLAGAGAQITRRSLACVSDALALSAVIYTPECYAVWRDRIEAAPDVMFPPVLERFRSGRDHLASDYIAAWDALMRHRATYLDETAGYDAVLLPTAPNMPPNAQRLMQDHAYFTAENLLTLRNTRIGNMLGLCALTLPTGVASTGISLMCPPMSEDRLLRLGAAAEAVMGGA